MFHRFHAGEQAFLYVNISCMLFFSFGCYPSQSHVNECVNARVCVLISNWITCLSGVHSAYTHTIQIASYLFFFFVVHHHSANQKFSKLFFPQLQSLFSLGFAFQKKILRLNSSRNFSAVTFTFSFSIFLFGYLLPFLSLFIDWQMVFAHFHQCITPINKNSSR